MSPSLAGSFRECIHSNRYDFRCMGAGGILVVCMGIKGDALQQCSAVHDRPPTPPTSTNSASFPQLRLFSTTPSLLCGVYFQTSCGFVDAVDPIGRFTTRLLKLMDRQRASESPLRAYKSPWGRTSQFTNPEAAR